MNKLELYIEGGENGKHILVLRRGLTPKRQPFESTDIKRMYAEAARIIEGDDDTSNELRIIDTTHKVVKSGSMTVSLSTLKDEEKVSPLA